MRDSVALADVHTQGDQLRKSSIADVPAPADLVVCHLNGNSAVVIGGVGTAPASVCLLHIQPDPAVRADTIVGAGLPAGRRKDRAALFHGQVAGHVVDGELINDMISRFAAVRTELRVID